MGEHDVYISYEDSDQTTADTICNAFEENGIKCWLKGRDGGVQRDTNKLIEAMKQSKLFVLVFSGDSIGDNYVITESENAFSSDIPILTYNIDKSKIDDSTEYVNDENLIYDGFTNPEEGLSELISDASELLERPISQPVISDKTKELQKEAVRITKKHISQRKRGRIWKFISDYKIPIAAILVILIVGAVVFAYMNVDDGIGGTSEDQKSLPNITMKITDFHVDDVRKHDASWNYSYFVGGTLSPQPGVDDDYRIIVDYYDKEGKWVDSTETPFKDAQIVNNGFLFGSTGSDANDINRVESQLVNDKDIVIAQSEAKL